MAYDNETPFIRRPQNIIIAALALVVVVLALWMVLGRSNAPATTAPTTSTSRPPAVPSTSATGQAPPSEPAGLPVGSIYDSACGLTGGTTVVPTDTPRDVTWENVSGWYFPLSKSSGPGRRTENGPWSCYARTPLGAVVAAYTIPIRLGGVAKDFNGILTSQTVPGVGQDALRAKGGNTAAADVAIPRGFLVDSFTKDEATITLYLHTPQLDAACSVHVQWFGGAAGDWLLRLESNGDSYAGCIKGAPSRYVPWGPTA